MSKPNFTPFYLEDLYNKFENKYHYNFSSACMPILSLEEIFEDRVLTQIKEILISSKLDYTTQHGSIELREALLNNLYPGLSPTDFIATAGAAEAIYLVMRSLFKSGDRIIVQKPIYQSLFQVAQDNGVEIIEWNINLETNSWDLSELEELTQLHSGFKALVINNPNNPTGLAFNKNELDRIIKSLKGKLLICDEVFQPISLTSTPSTVSIYENAVSICDLSKSFSMPGLRLGWIACQNKELLKQFSAMRNYLSLRTSLISEAIAPFVLNQAKKILELNKNILRSNIDKLFEKNREDLFFDLNIQKGAISSLCIFPKLKTQYQDLDCKKLIDGKSILLALGDNFGDDYQGYCRIGLGNISNLTML